MKHNSFFKTLTLIVIFIFSKGMTLALAGNLIPFVPANAPSNANQYRPSNQNIPTEQEEVESDKYHSFANDANRGDADALQILATEAKSGNIIAMQWYASYLIAKKNIEQAIIIYKKLSDAGVTRLLTEDNPTTPEDALGDFYLGALGWQKNPTQAAYWLQKAADIGSKNAQYLLGCMYEMGEGVPQNYAKAVILLEKAAAQRDPDALHNLGLLYEKGVEGVPQDINKASDLLIQAKYLGYEAPSPPPETFASLNEKANQGDAYSQFKLGMIYELGQEAPQSTDLARHWISLSAAQGYPQAVMALSTLNANTVNVHISK